MMFQSKFKVIHVAILSGRKVVVAEQIDNNDFIVEPGMYLGSLEILGFDMPRIVDVIGIQKTNTYVFWVEDNSEINRLAVGEIVELTESESH